MTPEERFAERLLPLRKRQGLSQARLADRLSALLGDKVSATAITKIEAGNRAVRLNEAVAAAHVLGVPLAELVAEDEQGLRLIELRRERDWYASQMEEAMRMHAEAQHHFIGVRDAIEELETQDGS